MIESLNLFFQYVGIAFIGWVLGKFVEKQFKKKEKKE